MATSYCDFPLSPEDLLKSYDTERRPIAVSLLKENERINRFLISTPKTSRLKCFRSKVIISNNHILYDSEQGSVLLSWKRIEVDVDNSRPSLQMNHTILSRSYPSLSFLSSSPSSSGCSLPWLPTSGKAACSYFQACPWTFPLLKSSLIPARAISFPGVLGFALATASLIAVSPTLPPFCIPIFPT